jgi:hypothetical protein
MGAFVAQAIIYATLIAIGLAITFCKCKWPIRALILSHPVKTDLILSVGLAWIHGGVLIGGIAAVAAALLCSLVLMTLRWLFGYVDLQRVNPGNPRDKRTRRVYVHGVFNREAEILPAPASVPTHP